MEDVATIKKIIINKYLNYLTPTILTLHNYLLMQKNIKFLLYSNDNYTVLFFAVTLSFLAI